MTRLEVAIAWRYLRSRRGSQLLSLISIIAMGGVVVGVSALILVLGVMNGLQKDLRDKILWLNTPIKDVTSGAIITPQQRFRQYVMSPKNRDANGNFHIQFLTNDDGNPIFSSLLASDRIRSLKVNLVGDNLGAGVTTAQLQLIHGGTSYLRSRTKDASGSAPLTAYDVSGKANRPTLAIIQAGINAPSSNPQTPENIELQERAVLAGPWQLIIDQSSSTPANANLNLAGLDDIEFIVTHDSYTIQ